MEVQVVQDLEQLPSEARGGVVSVGNFDGVHRGHQAILAALAQMAQRLQGPAVVFTFHPPPAQVLRPQQAPQLLCWPQRKVQLLAQHGAQVVILYPTSEQLLRLSPEEFFSQVVLQRLEAQGMVQGSNFRFGRERQGDVALLEQLCQESHLELEVVDQVRVRGLVVSSSLIRRLIAQGQMETAAQCLGRLHRIRGQVVEGQKRGQPLGFPTANLAQVPVLLPAEGVYAGRGFVGRECYAAAVHIGPNPTFDDPQPKVEVHLIGFSGSLYGQTLEVEIGRRLREVQKFSSSDQLRQQLTEDVEHAKQWFSAQSLTLPSGDS